MLFRILGPMWTYEALRLPVERETRSARILGALALHADKTVSVDALVDMVWGTTPPATARDQVRNCVSSIDRRLRCAGVQGLHRVARGYCLEIGADQLDMLYFEDSAERGRAAMMAEDPT